MLLNMSVDKKIPNKLQKRWCEFLYKSIEPITFSWCKSLRKTSQISNFLEIPYKNIEEMVRQSIEWIEELIYSEEPTKFDINHNIDKHISRVVRRCLNGNIPINQFQLANSLLRKAMRHQIKEKSNLGKNEIITLLDIVENYFDQVIFTSSSVWATQQQNLEVYQAELTSLYNIANVPLIVSNQEEVLDLIVGEISRLLKVEITLLLLHNDENSNVLELSASLIEEPYKKLIQGMNFFIDDNSIFAQVFKSGIPETSDTPLDDLNLTIRRRQTLELIGFRNILIVPLKVRNSTLGLICVANKHDDSPFNNTDIKLLTTISGQAAASIHNNQLISANQAISMEMVLSLAKVLDAKDQYTHNHSTNVATYATQLAKAIGFNSERCKKITMAGLLHDIGKIGIADAILHKPGRLTKTEREIIMLHTIKGAQILQPVRGLHSIIPAVKHHHENYNGTGYPGRLKGEDIPIEARIMNIADSYDTMSSNRVYQRAKKYDEIVREFRNMSGIQFDPFLTEAFLDILPTFTKKQEKQEKYFIKSDNKTRVEDISSNKLHINEFSAQRLRIFFNLSRTINSTLDDKEVRHRVVDAAQSLLTVDYVCLWIYKDEKLLPMTYSEGFYLDKDIYFKLGDDDFVGYVAYRRLPIIVTDFDEENRFPIADYIRKKELVSAIAVPVEIKSRLLGVLTAYTKSLANFSIDDITIITAIADQAAVALENAYLHQKASQLSNTDTLTNLYNYRYFQERLSEEIKRAKRYKNNVSLILIDIDSFKNYNNTYGYLLGDEVLKTIAEVIKDNTRETDFIARLEGEEFAIIATETNNNQAMAVAKRLSQAISQTPFPTNQISSTYLTVSMVIVSYPNVDNNEDILGIATDLIKRKDNQKPNLIYVYNGPTIDMNIE